MTEQQIISDFFTENMPTSVGSFQIGKNITRISNIKKFDDQTVVTIFVGQICYKIFYIVSCNLYREEEFTKCFSEDLPSVHYDCLISYKKFEEMNYEIVTVCMNEMDYTKQFDDRFFKNIFFIDPVITVSDCRTPGRKQRV